MLISYLLVNLQHPACYLHTMFHKGEENGVKSTCGSFTACINHLPDLHRMPTVFIYTYFIFIYNMIIVVLFNPGHSMI